VLQASPVMQNIWRDPGLDRRTAGGEKHVTPNIVYLTCQK